MGEDGLEGEEARDGEEAREGVEEVLLAGSAPADTTSATVTSATQRSILVLATQAISEWERDRRLQCSRPKLIDHVTVARSPIPAGLVSLEVILHKLAQCIH